MDILNDFQWVLSVLESCETRKQVNSSLRLFEQFLKKWDYEISEDIKLNYINKFENSQKDQICKIVSGKNE
jgi:uncharacterized protein YeaO (DUF488 family)